MRLTEEGAVFPQQQIGVFDAIRMHTVGAAATGFQEGIKGSLSPGKLADIVILSENPFEVNPDQLKNIRVVMTIIGGRKFQIPDSKFQIEKSPDTKSSASVGRRQVIQAGHLDAVRWETLKNIVRGYGIKAKSWITMIQ